MSADKDKPARKIETTEAIVPELVAAEASTQEAVTVSADSKSNAHAKPSTPEAASSRQAAGKDKQGIGRTFGLVAFLTVLSKLVGLLRDIVVAHAYGTGIVADAYNFAYLFTGNVLILFGGLGGPFHSSTVAILNARKENEGSGRLLSQIVLSTLAALLFITLLALLLSPLIASTSLADYRILRDHLHPDLLSWTDQQLKGLLKEQVLVQFVIMSPLIVLSGLIGISYGVLNVYNRVFWPSLSPAIASIAIIVAVLIFADPESAAFSGVPLALGTLIGALGQLLAQVPDLGKTNLKWNWTLKKQEGSDEYAAMLWPAVFSTSVGQLTVYVDAFFTSAIGQGAWTAVLMSNRLVQLPLGVLLTAMLVPILPRFTEQYDSGALDELKDELRRSLRFLWFCALPLTVIFLAIPAPIIRLLFEHGEFSKESTEMVTIALLFLAPSIFFYVARDLITRVFYAMKDAKTPFRVALLAIFVKGLLDWYFVYKAKLDLRGISLASTLITILNLSLLSWFLRRKIGLLGFSKLLKPLSIMLFASLICGLSSFYIVDLLSSGLPAQKLAELFSFAGQAFQGRLLLLVKIGLASFSGLLLYFFVCVWLKLEEPAMLMKRIAKKRVS